MIAIGIGILAPLTILAFVFAVFSQRSDLKRHVTALDTSLAAGGGASGEILRKLINDGDRSKLQQRFNEAGWYKTSMVHYVGYVAVSIAVGLAGAFGLLVYLQRTTPMYIGMAVVVALCAAMVPNFFLNRAIEQRKLAVQRTLPDLLDMVSTTVEAGIALNGALSMSVDAIRGPLAEELREVLADVRMGRSRVDALTAMANRVKQIDLTATVTAMVQTEKLGGNIGAVLDELALEARDRRLMRAEEIAAQLPVKMVIPMALFMLPALFVMIFGSVVADLSQKLH